eukprot:5637573-Amphidinium_carterae.1
MKVNFSDIIDVGPAQPFGPLDAPCSFTNAVYFQVKPRGYKETVFQQGCNLLIVWALFQALCIYRGTQNSRDLSQNVSTDIKPNVATQNTIPHTSPT